MPSKDYFKEKYAEMGKMSSDEKKASVIALVLVALIMTTSIHGIPMGWRNSQSFKAPANFGNTPVSNSVHQTDTLESVGNG